MTSSQMFTAKGERTRARIVVAAADLIFARGVAGTTLDDIKAAAGASSSQLYHYFSSKDEIVRAVITRQTDVIIGSQEPELTSLDSVAGLRAWRDLVVRVQRALDCRGGCPLGSLGSELAEHDGQSRVAVADGFTRWEAAIRAGLRAMRGHGHLVPTADTDDLALSLLAALQGGLLLGQIHRSTRPLEVALDTCIAHIASLTPPNGSTTGLRASVEGAGNA